MILHMRRNIFTHMHITEDITRKQKNQCLKEKTIRKDFYFQFLAIKEYFDEKKPSTTQ